MAIKKISLTIVLVLTFSIWAKPPIDKVDNQLAKESSAKCERTASIKATPEMIIEKVNKAAELLEKEGSKAYAKLKGKNSEFLFAGTYVWVNDLNGVMLMHPVKPILNGKNLVGLKDGNGKRFFVEMIQKLRSKGSGWTSYTWPKPGEKTRSLKISYARAAVMDGDTVMVGAGTYDLTKEECDKLSKD